MDIKAMTAEELIERRAAIASEVDAPEADLNALEEEVRAINAELEERRQAEAQREEVRQAVAEGAGEVIKTFNNENKKERSTMEIRDSHEYIEAFANYCKTGDDTECRALLSSNVNTGVVPVPTFVGEIVAERLKESKILSRVRRMNAAGNVKVGFEISATAATNHTESANSAVTEETLVLGVVNLIPVSIKKWISISDEVNDMRGEAFLRYIYDELTYQIAKKAADNLISAIDSCGTQSTTTCVGVPVVIASAASVGLVASAMSMLSAEAANPTVVLNRASWGAFKAAAYAANYGIDPFEGLRVVFTDALKSVTAASSGETFAIVGDFGHGAIANFPAGDEIEIKMDDKTLMEKDLIRILGREYVAVAPVAPNAFVKVVKGEGGK